MQQPMGATNIGGQIVGLPVAGMTMGNGIAIG